MKKAKMGAQTVATSAASEDTLKPNAMTSQIKAQSRAVAGGKGEQDAQCGGYAFAAFKIEKNWPHMADQCGDGDQGRSLHQTNLKHLADSVLR